ncbi:unnamed protein product [Cladocopium goreaui]|uniref:SAP domain-containing protein n=1 Tax=Cladocopium goreaui TaxID=2562237 RepID=A0A9P1C5R1_9DINO|nr:unnamed protein product [Cladocopium goreaui]
MRVEELPTEDLCKTSPPAEKEASQVHAPMMQTEPKEASWEAAFEGARVEVQPEEGAETCPGVKEVERENPARMQAPEVAEDALQMEPSAFAGTQVFEALEEAPMVEKMTKEIAAGAEEPETPAMAETEVEGNEVAAEVADPPAKELKAMSYKELVALAKQRGVRASGKKAEILKRLQRANAKAKAKPAKPAKANAGQEVPSPRHSVKEVEDTLAASQRGGSIDVMPLAELRKACEDLQMPSTGSREALLKRLAMYVNTAATPLSQSQGGGEESQAPGGNLLTLPETQACHPFDQGVSAGASPVQSQQDEGGDSIEATEFPGLERGNSPVPKGSPRPTWSPRRMPPPSEVPKKARKAPCGIQDLSTKTAKELQQICKDRGLSCRGGKALLLERLVEAEQAQETPTPASPVGLPVPPTRSPLRHGDAFMEAVEASQDSAASAATTVLTSFAKNLAALPLSELRSACEARDLPSHGTQQQLVGRLAALLVVPPDPVGASQATVYEEVPASMDTLSLAGLQAACRACGLSSNGSASVLAERLASHVAEETQEDSAPADAAVHEDAEDPPGVKTPPPTASVASPVRDAVEMQTEASPADSIPAAQPDMSAEGSSQEAKAEASQQLEPLEALESQLVGDLDEPVDEPADEPIDTVEPPVPTELPRLDDGFRAGLRLLHTDELRRACLDRGLNFQGTKGTLLNRLLEHFARAPLPTPTQEVSSNLKPLEASAKTSKVDPKSSPKQQVAPVVEAPAQAAPEAPVPPDLTVAVEPPSKKQKLQPKAVQIPSEIQQLRPLQSTAKAPVLRTLSSRPRTATAVAPNFTALWRTMCPAQQTEAPKSGQGVGLSVAAPGRKRTKRTERTRTARTAPRNKLRVGSCHGRTVAGAPCRNAGRAHPAGARFAYCARHSQHWARYESVGVEDLPPKPLKAVAPSDDQDAMVTPSEVQRPVATPARAAAKRVAAQPVKPPAKPAQGATVKPKVAKVKTPSPKANARRKDAKGDGKDHGRVSPKKSQTQRSPKAVTARSAKRSHEALELPGLSKVMALLPNVPSKRCKR